MRHSRAAILAKRSTIWTRALSFLQREHRAEAYWWEVFEIGRRLALTGFVLLVLPPEMETLRLLFAQTLTIFSLSLIALIKPYKRVCNNILAFLAQVLLLFVFSLAMMMCALARTPLP